MKDSELFVSYARDFRLAGNSEVSALYEIAALLAKLVEKTPDAPKWEKYDAAS